MNYAPTPIDRSAPDGVLRHSSRLSLFLLLLMLQGIAGACTEEGTKKIPDDAWVVALLLPFTGGDASIGTNYERAAIMAADAINEAGGIQGKQIYFITKDTHSEKGRAKKALKEILQHDVVAVIGPEGSEIARETLPVLQKRKILFISPVVSGAETIEVSEGFPWIRLAPSSAKLGHALANYLINEQALDTVSTVYSGEDYNTDFVQALENRFTQLGGTVEASILLADRQLGYSDEVSVLRNGATENVILSSSTNSAARFVNDLTIAEKAHKWHWFLSPALETPVFLQNTITDALEGAIGVGVEVENRDSAFINGYQARWSDTPGDGAFYYFDAVTVLALAMKLAIYNNNGKLEYDSLSEAVANVAVPSGVQVRWNQIAEGLEYIQSGRSIYYSGLTGALLFDDTGQQVKARMKTWTITNGQIGKNESL